MFNFGILINKFYDIFNKQQTIFEVVLNLSFVLILFMIAFIFYWDSINRSVINTSRCKAIINNDDSEYKVNFYDDASKSKKIFSISYDNSKKHNAKISCEGICNKSSDDSSAEKTLINVPYFDYNQQVIDDSITKICYCTKTSTIANKYNSQTYDKHPGLTIDGDEFIADYYKDFYKNMKTVPKSYDKKLYFSI